MRLKNNQNSPYKLLRLSATTIPYLLSQLFMDWQEVKKPIKKSKNKQLNKQEASQSNDSIPKSAVQHVIGTRGSYGL